VLRWCLGGLKVCFWWGSNYVNEPHAPVFSEGMSFISGLRIQHPMHANATCKWINVTNSSSTMTIHISEHNWWLHKYHSRLSYRENHILRITVSNDAFVNNRIKTSYKDTVDLITNWIIHSYGFNPLDLNCPGTVSRCLQLHRLVIFQLWWSRFYSNPYQKSGWAASRSTRGIAFVKLWTLPQHT
jgi:hypothetical protein